MKRPTDTKDSTYLSAAQIRAARALLDLSQDELALSSGISIATIRKLEAGHISPRSETTRLIKHAFEGAGLEFQKPDGVRRRPDDIMMYEGYDGIRAFFDNVYETANHKGGEIILVCNSEQPFVEALDGYEKIYIERMTSIRHKMKMKCIVTEDVECTPSTAYCEYRLLSKAYVDSVPFYIYDDKYAIFVFGPDLYPKITVLQSAVVSDAFHRQFNSMWDKATPLNKLGADLALIRKKTA